MAEPSRALLATIRIIDTFTDLTGTIIAWLSMPLVLAVAYEVFARYLFNAPTIWSFDVTYMLYGTLFMLGAAYALHKGAHIRTDFFWEQLLGPHARADRLHLLHRVLLPELHHPRPRQLARGRLRLPDRRDVRPDAVAADPVAVQVVVPLACLLLLIQGVSELLKSFYMARTGIELEHKEKVEV